ncbi:molybdopterin-dependent oxidoreductase [Sporichthya brevicatena]|uniref:Molybdopterin-dependent oxidoreductase n=1 Tax=Sporichthya brevicatena TaxID=171442 RepID=A0ABN1GA74_9ACTN
MVDAQSTIGAAPSSAPAEPAAGEVRLGRRTFLTFLVGVPALSLATSVTLDGFLGDVAEAATGSTQAVPSGQSIEETFDIADAIIMAGAPTMPLLKLDIGTDGIVRFDIPRIEMGQGMTTSMAMLIAEELDCPLEQVKVTCADARPELACNQMTAGSCSHRQFHDPLRVLAATAKMRMTAAAAQQWGVDPSTLSVHDGVIVSGDGRTATFGELSRAAADPNLKIGQVRLKEASQYKIVGKPTRRVDALDIVTGRKKFTMDLQVPGALPTMVRRAPTLNAELQEFRNKAQVEKMPGVIATALLKNGVAVVAETFEQARAGAAAVEAVFDSGPVANESNETVGQKLRASMLPFMAPPAGENTVEAEYEWAPAAHGFLEVECAIADIRSDGGDLWSGFQAPIVAAQQVALACGLPIESVKAHVVPVGGGFGRRVFFDAAMEAALVSKQVGRPIKLMWTRTDDFRHGRHRPQNVHRFRATILDGKVVSSEQRVAGVSTDYRHGLGEIFSAIITEMPQGAKQAIVNDGFGQGVFTTMVSSPYNLGAQDKRQLEVSLGMPTSSYRSVPCQTARGSEEMFIDELAEKLKVDPYEFRRALLKSDRSRAVLDAVAERGQWGKAMPEGHAQGIAFHSESRSHTAALIELDARNPKLPRVTKAVIAIDCGKPINPLGIIAQMEGGLAEAISLTLKAGLHIVDGLPLEGSFSQYKWLRMRDMPSDIQVIVMPDKGDPIGGTGEVGMAAPTGAIAQAYAKVTGIRPRKFPIIHPVDFEPFAPGQLPPPAFS